MPPKIRITKESIIEAALKLVRSGGISTLNARALANELNCSTQPVFSCYSSMEEVREEVIKKAGEYYNKYFDESIKRRDIPPYKASGLSYIQFAKDEKELFKLLFMRDRSGENTESSDHSFDTAVNMIMKSIGINFESAWRFHLEMWIFVHGIAVMTATSYFDMEDELINQVLTDMYQGMVSVYKNILR